MTTISRVTRDRYQTYAGFLELGWQITPKLKAIAGTRATADTRLSEIPVTPRASLIYSATDHLTLKYIYTQAFVAPPPYFKDLTYDDGLHISHTASNFGAEKATSNEMNLNYAATNLNLGASAYYGQQSNLIIPSEFFNGTQTVFEQQLNKDGTFTQSWEPGISSLPRTAVGARTRDLIFMDEPHSGTSVPGRHTHT